jgi:hypothetical protein
MLPYAAGETCVSCQLHACSPRRRSCTMFFLTPLCVKGYVFLYVKLLLWKIATLAFLFHFVTCSAPCRVQLTQIVFERLGN